MLKCASILLLEDLQYSIGYLMAFIISFVNINKVLQQWKSILLEYSRAQTHNPYRLWQKVSILAAKHICEIPTLRVPFVHVCVGKGAIPKPVPTTW